MVLKRSKTKKEMMEKIDFFKSLNHNLKYTLGTLYRLPITDWAPCNHLRTLFNNIFSTRIKVNIVQKQSSSGGLI